MSSMPSLAGCTLLGSVLLTACGPSAPEARVAPLANFARPELEGHRFPSGSAVFTLHYDTSHECLALGTDVKAFVGDRPVTIEEHGLSSREECGDCGIGKSHPTVTCTEPVLRAEDMPPAGSAFELTITDGATTFRAAFGEAPALDVVEPASAEATVGDDVVFHVSAGSPASGMPAVLSLPDGEPFDGVRLGSDPSSASVDGRISYTLGAGTCVGAATTFDVDVAIPVHVASTRCDGLVACTLSDRTRPCRLRVTYPNPGRC